MLKNIFLCIISMHTYVIHDLVFPHPPIEMRMLSGITLLFGDRIMYISPHALALNSKSVRSNRSSSLSTYELDVCLVCQGTSVQRAMCDMK